MPRLNPKTPPEQFLEHKLRQLILRMGGKKPLSATEIREQFKVILFYAKLHNLKIPDGFEVVGTEFNPRPVELPSAPGGSSGSSALTVPFGNELEEENGEKK